MRVSPGLLFVLLVPFARGEEIVWTEASSLTLEGKAFADTVNPYDRLPRWAEGKVPDRVWELGRQSSGVSVRFVTDATNVSIRCDIRAHKLVSGFSTGAGHVGVDVYGKVADGSYRYVCNINDKARPATGTGAYQTRGSFRWQPGREALVYFPMRSEVTSLRIGVPKGFTVSPAPARGRKPVVHYGTSIVHGGLSTRPGIMFAAVEGRVAGVEIVNLGFSGSGKLEPEMVDVLAAIDASLYVIDCSWNVAAPTLTARLGKFVRALVAKRPDAPVLLCACCSGDLKDATDAVGHPVAENTRRTKEIYEKLRAESPDYARLLHYLPNEGMLPQDGDATVDHIHPNDYGHRFMGAVYGEKIRSILGEQK